MATIKKNAAKVSKTATQKNASPKTVAKNAATGPNKEKSGDELVVDNITELSKVVTSLSATLDLLVQKAEGMAYHIIATEAILAELVAANGLDLARVNTRIRAKIAAGTDGNANQAIDAAAAIASPLPRRQRT